MAEVGVLELQIRDNAAEAGSGLDQLAGALGRVKNAIPGNKSSLGLSKVGTELNSLARQINGAKSGTATIIKNVTALFNSISGLGKLKRIDLDTTPIDKIKNAIGDGLNLGNTGTQLKNLRDAFSKPWDANGAVAAMGSIVEVANTLKQEDTVGKISAVATALSNYSSAITKYTKAYKDLPKSNDKMEAIIQNLAFGISKGQIEEQQQLYEEATAQARENWEKSGKHGIPLDLQFHVGKGKDTTSAGQIMMDLDRLLGPAVEETTNLQDAFVKVDKSVGGANIQLVEFKDTITSIDTTGMDRLSKTFDSLERKSGAVKSIADMTKEVDEAMSYMDIKGVNLEAYNKAIDSIISYLDGKIKYTGRNGIQKFIDAELGIGKKTTRSEKYYNNIFPADMLEEAAKPISDGNMEEATENLNKSVGNLNNSLIQLVDLSERVSNAWTYGMGNAQTMVDKMREAVNMWLELRNKAIGAGNQNALGAGNSPLLLGPGGVAPENMMSTYVQAGEQFKPDWTFSEDWKPDFTFVEQLEEIPDKAAIAEEALRRVEMMKEQLLSDIKAGKYTEEQALEIAQSIQQMEERIPTIVEGMVNTGKAAREVREAIKESATDTKEWLGAAQQLNERIAKMYNDFPNRSIEDYFYGFRYARNKETGENYKYGQPDAISNALQGNGTDKEYMWAVQEVAKTLGMTAEEVTEKIGAMRDALHSTTSVLEETSNQESQTTEETHRLRDAFNNLRSGVNKFLKPMQSLLSRFASIAKYRMIRAVLKHITGGFTEGVQNVYEYSKLIGTDLAPAMDSAATSFLQFKNSIGAAVAPLIQAFIPIIRQVISVVIDGINYINQFFALMRGQATWTRALPAATTAFGKQEKAAKKAGAAVKDLLADWDELNIIQSNTSGAGSGAGTSAAEDYLNMFEEVGTFDNGVRKVVDYIKDNFDDILKIAELVGAAVLAWKVAAAFEGLIATLASFVAAGALIDLEWHVSTLLNDQYLKTGDIGWLVADVLKTLIGGVLMKKILGTVLKGEYAYLGIPIMLTVNAAARTVAVLSDPNVSALSTEALVSNLTSALEGGAVAGYLMKTAGFATKTAIGGGTAAALVTFGVLTGLKADVEAVQSGDINDEYIKGKALEALAIGLGTALIAKLLVPGVSTAKALGFGAATGVGAVLVTMGATLGIQAYVEAVNSGITEETVKKTALSSLAMGLGGALFAKMAGASLLASLGIGGLVALGTVATIGAAVGITALLTTSKEKIKWGNESLTEDQVKAFVNEKIFDVNLPVAINLVKGKIEDTKQAEEDLKTKAGDILPVINTLTLGFDIAGSLKQLEAEMFGEDGLVSQFRKTVKAKQIEVEAALTLVPIKTENGEDMSAAYLMQINEGWSKIDGIMGTLGKQLADAMKEAYDSELNGNLNEMAVKTVADVSRTMLEISTAITTAHSTNEMKKSFNEGLENLSGKGIKDILDFYKEQKKATTDVMSEAYEVYFSQLDDQRLTNEILLQKALENNGEYAGHTVEYYQGEIERIKSMYSDLEKMRSASIDAAIAFFESGDGLTQVREAILKAILEAPEDMDVNTGLITMGWEGSGIASLLNPDGTMIEGAKEKVQELFSEILTSAYGVENARHIMDAIDAGAIKFGDIFNKEVIEMLTSKMKFENIDESARESVRQQWIALLSEILGDKTGVDKVVSEAKEQMSTAAEEIVNAATPGTVAEEMNNGTGSSLGQYATDMENVVEQTQKAQQAINNLTLDTVSFDTTGVQDSANVAASAIENMAKRIRDAFASLDGLSYSMDVNGNVYSGAMSVLIPVQQKAMGGFVRSGDLVMANENGDFEMMGKMGNQPVVANNQQIVNGISNGVAQANSGVESRLTTIERLLQRLLQKDFVARAVPDSRWGTHNAKSDAALERVIG